MTELVVFSDLDGTLLDHENYSYTQAQPALDALASRGIPLILATSKTAAEVAVLHQALNLGDWPAIVENGAGIYRPGASDVGDASYASLRAALDSLPADLRAPYKGFGDMTDAEVGNLTAWVEAGGVLVVFGDAGTHDFSYPDPTRRDDPTRPLTRRPDPTRRHLFTIYSKLFILNYL